VLFVLSTLTKNSSSVNTEFLCT